MKNGKIKRKKNGREPLTTTRNCGGYGTTFSQEVRLDLPLQVVIFGRHGIEVESLSASTITRILFGPGSMPESKAVGLGSVAELVAGRDTSHATVDLSSCDHGSVDDEQRTLAVEGAVLDLPVAGVDNDPSLGTWSSSVDPTGGQA